MKGPQVEGKPMIGSRQQGNHFGKHRPVHARLPLNGTRGTGFAARLAGAQAGEIPAGGGRAMGKGLRFTKWSVFLLSALTAFIIAGGSAVLGVITSTKAMPSGYGWLCLGVLTGLVAMANDVRSQLHEPPVDLRSR
jgi:hypothetical protein